MSSRPVRVKQQLPLQREAEAQYVYCCIWMHIAVNASHINLKLLKPLYLKLSSWLLH